MTRNASAYQPGGDIYAEIARRYGPDAANIAATLAARNDGGVALRNHLSNLRAGGTGIQPTFVMVTSGTTKTISVDAFILQAYPSR